MAKQKHGADMLTTMFQTRTGSQNEKETHVGESAESSPNRLWNIGRTENRKIVSAGEQALCNTDFVVEVLIDGKAAPQRSRQSHVALQAFMISEALHHCVGIPLTAVMSFCTFIWGLYGHAEISGIRGMEEKQTCSILNFTALPNNRDGLIKEVLGSRAGASEKRRRKQNSDRVK
ncbi:MAG: hypothetical protein ACLTTO_15445 [Lachnospiraceae bacterium]